MRNIKANLKIQDSIQRLNPSLQYIPRNEARPSTWGEAIPSRVQTYQVSLIQNMCEELPAGTGLSSMGSIGLPNDIETSVRHARSERIKQDQIHISEVHLSLTCSQNKLIVWDYVNELNESIIFSNVVKNVFLIKIIGQQSVLWVDTQDNSGYILIVGLLENEAGRLGLTLSKTKSRKKAINPNCAKWISRGNFLVFVTKDKKIGSLFYDEIKKRVNIRKVNPPKNHSSGTFKRIKRTLLSIFSKSKFYEFKIRILNEKLFIMKTCWQCSGKGKKLDKENPLRGLQSGLNTEDKLEKKSQTIYSFSLAPKGKLNPLGKLNLRKLFEVNRAVLHSQFHLFGGFDFGLRVVDFLVKEIPHTKILEKVMKPQQGKDPLDFLSITQDLSQELQNLSMSPQPNESGLLSQNLILLLENGVEIEVQPYEATIQTIKIISLKLSQKMQSMNQDFNLIKFWGYLSGGEILFSKAKNTFIIFK